MDIFQAIILGVVQGVGEFLPISSTAHLVLVPYLTGWEDPGLGFDVALHMGTLLAVLTYFWKDWSVIVRGALSSGSQINKDKKIGYDKNLLWLLLAASVPGALAGYFLENIAETTLRSPLIIAGTLSIVGGALYLVDRYATHRKTMSEIGLKDSLLIGLSQAAAIIPGVSRSGATMTVALILGLSRETAARFSFLLSTPIIFGAALVKVPSLLESGITAPIFFGVLAAAVSGYVAIKYMLRFIQKVGYAPFFWYRLVLAIIIGLVYLMR